MLNETFSQWKLQILTLECKIDDVDWAFECNVKNTVPPLTDDELKKATAEYEIERQKVWDELKTHCSTDSGL